MTVSSHADMFIFCGLTLSVQVHTMESPWVVDEAVTAVARTDDSQWLFNHSSEQSPTDVACTHGGRYLELEHIYHTFLTVSFRINLGYENRVASINVLPHKRLFQHSCLHLFSSENVVAF